MAKKKIFLPGLIAIFVFCLLSVRGAEANTFSNSYVSFDLPEIWKCYLEQTEWICRTSEPGLAEAVIILTAKESGSEDSLAFYKEFLSHPRTITGPKGLPIQSTVYRVEEKQINGHPWVDGFHFASEMPNYYTRYAATTKDRIGILVTFSAHRSSYTRYSTDFVHAVTTLRVTATNSKMGQRFADDFSAGAGTFAENINMAAPAEPMQEDPMHGLFGSDSAKSMVGLILIIAAVGVYLMTKKKSR
jgi:hypothetical protein